MRLSDLRIFVLVFCLAACDAAPSAAPPPQLDARLDGLFAASCALCHAAANSAAPQLGDEAWQARWAKGFDLLLANTINGLDGMPPLGGCAACSYDDLSLLVQYLAQRSPIEDKK